jgi:D-3-phosphoglycerate dehydrogenase
MRPRVVEINHYFMDMVPAGDMVLIQNEDRPGMIGIMGTEFGQAKVNIADMAISRRETDGGVTAFCVLKVDDTPPESLLVRLRSHPGLLKVASVKLPPEKKA